MRLRDAMAAGARDPELPIRINAGRCEATADGYVTGVPCGKRARWWRWHQFRCSEHKDQR